MRATHSYTRCIETFSISVKAPQLIRLVGLLCELPDVSKQDLAELKKVYEQLPEGFSTAVVSRARELLQNASASASA
jgi:hypothetical protein